jgi:hypothetical protein
MLERAPQQERAMAKLKQVIVGAAAAGVIALLPLGSAMAGGYGYAPVHAWGVGRGLFGAAVALATLPLTIASAVISSVSSAAPYPAPAYGNGAYGYAAQPAYPPAYYAPRPVYYAAPRAYYGPRPYYAPRPGYNGPGYYRSAGPAYRRR